MRIGMVCFASVGGSSTVAVSLARHLVLSGHEALVMAPAPPPSLRAADGVGFRPVPAAGDPLRPGSGAAIERLAGSIAAVAAAERVDLLHAHYALPHAVAAVRARDRFPPGPLPAVVTTLHGTDVTLFGAAAASESAIREALRESDGVSAVSDALADAAEARYGVARPVVIPNFVTPRAGPGRADVRPEPSGERILLHVSTLRPVKRAADCVAILAGVLRRLPCRLWIVGDGPDAEVVRVAAAREGLADRVSFHGERADVDAFLDRADLLLMPSADEAFGMAALEAMACGVPVVGSRVGGLVDVARDGVCARLLPVGDVEGMAAAACELLLDPRLAASYAAAGRRIAAERYAPAAALSAYLDRYAAALRRSGRRCPS